MGDWFTVWGLECAGLPLRGVAASAAAADTLLAALPALAILLVAAEALLVLVAVSAVAVPPLLCVFAAATEGAATVLSLRAAAVAARNLAAAAAVPLLPAASGRGAAFFGFAARSLLAVFWTTYLCIDAGVAAAAAADFGACWCDLFDLWTSAAAGVDKPLLARVTAACSEAAACLPCKRWNAHGDQCEGVKALQARWALTTLFAKTTSRCDSCRKPQADVSEVGYLTDALLASWTSVWGMPSGLERTSQWASSCDSQPITVLLLTSATFCHASERMQPSESLAKECHSVNTDLPE